MPGIKRKILLVDDQPEMRKSAHRILRLAGYEVVEAEDGRKAISMFSAENPDLVLSDLRMPAMDGIELLHELRKTSAVPFVLMTGFAEMIQSAEAYEMGVDGFLLKPFQQKDLLTTLEDALSSKAKAPASGATGNEASVKELYCGIPVGEFVSGREIRYPIFLKLSESKFVRIAFCGEDLSSAKIAELQQKGIRFLYLQREDFKQYVAFASRLATIVLANEGIAASRKAAFLRHSSEVILEFGFQQHVDQAVFELARVNIEQSLSLLTDNSPLLEILDSLTSHSTKLYAHSVGVALVACLTGRAMGWESSPLFFRLVSGAILHDIGKRDFPAPLQEKDESAMSAEELELWKEHPRLGAECLAKLENIPAEILQIVLHHHELSDGSGFPAGLTGPKIHPVAKVIAGADEFFKLYRGESEPGLPPAEVIERLEKKNKKFGSFPRLEFLAALKKAFIK